MPEALEGARRLTAPTEESCWPCATRCMPRTSGGCARSLKGATLPAIVGGHAGRQPAVGEGRGPAPKRARAGADNIANFLAWCEDAEVEVVTLWLLSTDNLNRPAVELRAARDHREHRGGTGGDRPVADQPGRFPGSPARRDRSPAEGECRCDCGCHGDGGQRRRRLRRPPEDHRRGQVAAHRARGQRHDHRGAGRDPRGGAHRRAPLHQGSAGPGPRHPDLRRTAPVGFLLWQSAHSEFYFCEAYWPDFRHVDFLRALRAYSERHRRFGS